MKKFILILTGLLSLANSYASDSTYHNVALNPKAGDGSYPQATSNSQYNDTVFAANNAINGQTSNIGYGKKMPSWGPHKRNDLWFKIDFGKEVEIDRAVIWVRAKFKPFAKIDHDSYFKTGVMEFSDGSKHPFKLERTADAQEIKFPKHKTEWIKFTKLVPNKNLWCGFTEVQIWGQ